MSDSPVVISREGSIATLTINRPDKLNALNSDVLAKIGDAVAELDADPQVRAVIVTGAGDRAFVAGADIAELADLTPEQAHAFSVAGGRSFGAMERSAKPFIAVVNGFALGGGCELALACDVILASDRAKFGLPEVTLGVIPGFGGTQRLSRLIGPNAAKMWTMTGGIHDAETAKRLGLAYEVYPADELMANAQKIAATIAKRAPLAVAACKRVIAQGAHLPLEAAVAMESEAFAECFGTEDLRTGMQAFLAKTKAKFEGR